MMKCVTANWTAPTHVKGFTTTRIGGMSQGEFQGFNPAFHVGDNEKSVEENRKLLKNHLNLPGEPCWLTQEHTNIVVNADPNSQQPPVADASYTNQKNRVCVVMTADCLPILITNKEGSEIASIHGGWRGLLGGIIDNTLQKFKSPPEDLIVWLGPAIGPEIFELGDEVREQFVSTYPESSKAFKPFQDKWLGNIYLLARQQLKNKGVEAIFGGDFCTYSNSELFFSYRRDKITGRMATLVWIEDSSRV